MHKKSLEAAAHLESVDKDSEDEDNEDKKNAFNDDLDKAERQKIKLEAAQNQNRNPGQIDASIHAIHSHSQNGNPSYTFFPYPFGM